MEKLENMLIMYGQVSILYYVSRGSYIIHKIGEFESLETEHKKFNDKLKFAGFEDESNSLTVLELPKNLDVLFKIIHCNGLEAFLEENSLK